MQSDVLASQGEPKVRTQMRASTQDRQSMFISLWNQRAKPSSRTLGFHLITPFIQSIHETSSDVQSLVDNEI